MSLPRFRKGLRKVVDERAQDLQNAQAAQRKSIRKPGAIKGGWINYGKGANRLPYGQVDLAAHPYGPFYYTGSSPPVLVGELAYYIHPGMEHDAIGVLSPAAETFSEWRTFFEPITDRHFSNTSWHIYSVDCAALLDAHDVELRVTTASTAFDLGEGTGDYPVVLAESDTFRVDPAVPGLHRVHVAFDGSLALAGPPRRVRFEHRSRPVGSASAGTNDLIFLNFMLEQVAPEQKEPSKFVLPNPNRGEVSWNLLLGLTDWIAPTLLNGWVNFGSPRAVAGYRKMPWGEVQLRGTIKDGTGGAAGFVLPADYRPANNRGYAVPAGPNGTGRVTIDASNGNVLVSVGSGDNTQLALDGVRFPAA